MRSKNLQISLLLVPVLFLSGCQNASEQSAKMTNEVKKANKLPVSCQQPAPVRDIWKLEPMLIKKGAITASMALEEKAQRIRAYITRKNEQYQICLKGSKGK